MRQSGGDLAFLKEYCTVRVGGPRQSGHTSVVNRLIEHWGEKVLVVTLKQQMGNQVRASRKATVSTLDKCKWDGLEAIIVDVASQVSASKMNEIYRKFAVVTAGRTPTFVVLMG